MIFRSCLIFFFIGAPLGAIIRKGGLGTPLVISVFLFIVYYIIDNTGYKMARDGHWVVWHGMWISTFVLAPLGIYVTYKAMNDSAVFNPDAYRNLLSKLLGVHQTRSVEFKEVIINDISETEALKRIHLLQEETSSFLDRLRRTQFYTRYWTKGYPEHVIGNIGTGLDNLADYLSDSRNKAVVNKLLDLPVISRMWIYRPTTRRWQSILAFVLFPLSIPVWCIGLYKQRHLKTEMRTAQKVLAELEQLLGQS